tara:strand:+ start:111 stop:707 length:597 start_codon:yes stop_codon:yes gene_type:complete
MSQIKLLHSGGNGVILSAPASNPAADRTLTLPGDADGTIATTATAGKILQVVSTTKTDVFSEDTANATYTSAALAATITPSNASNKILISVNANIGIESASRLGFGLFKAGTILVQGDADGSLTRVTSQTDNSSSGRAEFIGGEFLDTAGGTNAITYDIRLIHGQGSTRFLYLNRNHSGTSANFMRSTSTITLMEVAA